jgi:hypothetical protein
LELDGGEAETERTTESGQSEGYAYDEGSDHCYTEAAISVCYYLY